ncbi:hypothetical protein OIU34_19555 [Pararhizobium sp. BT-229]|uniref:hypothetical protein n=1 Tax=Pararhizobium sp. BT-229 TaxID=2986923 RepID=UPI0021F6EF76|nr:hypothetical protein [Pararhizobium sp. BT-229]MCV9964081.1 hypothetical protein [Pararhizobium sp. BT-229]
MAYEGPVTRDAIRERLKTKWDRASRETKILLDDERIGRVVTYGKKDMLRVSKTGLRPTVYNGRVMLNDHDFNIEASSTGSLLNALAAQISRALRADRKAAPVEQDVEVAVPTAAPTHKF